MGERKEERREAVYRIGTVANLTGLSAHTIRAWERRYGSIRPRRSAGGTRLYDDRDVARLQLMEALCRSGQSARELAPLSKEELRERLARGRAGDPDSVARSPSRRIRIALLDPILAEQMRTNPVAQVGFEVKAGSDDLATLLAALAGESVDVAIAHLVLLGDEPTETALRYGRIAGADTIFVIYEFASRSRLDGLAKAGIKLLRGPVSVDALRRALSDHAAAQRRPDPSCVAAKRPVAGRASPKRTFDDTQLARLRELRSTLECECSNHLAAIVTQLLAFERYSRECEEVSPADAAMHARFAEETAHARSIVEALLVRLVERDGISV